MRTITPRRIEEFEATSNSQIEVELDGYERKTR